MDNKKNKRNKQSFQKKQNKTPINKLQKQKTKNEIFNKFSYVVDLWAQLWLFAHCSWALASAAANSCVDVIAMLDGYPVVQWWLFDHLHRHH